MAGDLEIPKVGKLPKKVVIPVAVGVAAFIGWRFWQARQGGPDAESTIEDGEFGAVDTAVPDTLNPFPGSFSGGGGSGGSSDSSGDRNNDGQIGPGEFTTNGEWTAYVVDKLAGERWSSNDVQLAIGLALAGKPTTSEQQNILRAAVAAGGNPPQGSLTIVTGGNTAITVAPTGVKATADETTASVAFGSVPGAASYRVFRGGVAAAAGTGSGSPITVGGLTPNTPYTFQVAAVTTSGTVGPKSASTSVRTKSYAVAKPGMPAVSGVTATAATATVGAVAHADEYIWYLNGAQRALTEGTRYTFGGLKPGTTYRVSVVARGFHQYASARSAERAFTTKKK